MGNIYNWDEINEKTYINREGEYTVKVANYESKISESGNQMDVYTLETKDNASIKIFMPIVESALWKYKKFVKACGLETTGQVDFDTLNKSLMGRKLKIVVKKEIRVNSVTGEEKEVCNVSDYKVIEA